MAVTFSPKQLAAKAQKLQQSQVLVQQTAQVTDTPAVKALQQMQQLVAPKSETAMLADEYLAIHQHLQDSKAFELQERLEALKAQLQSIANESADPDEQVQFVGDTGSLVFGARTKTLKTKSNEIVLTALSAETALKICKFGVTELRKYLTPVELEAVTTPERGARSLKSVIHK